MYHYSSLIPLTIRQKLRAVSYFLFHWIPEHDCPYCSNGWVPSTDYTRAGKTVRTTCLICKGIGKINHKNKFLYGKVEA